jgi:hypothetical protein
MDQILGLLRNQMRNDFAEYNARPYQEETRHALLNLYNYAYDAEVRLAAGMVLDYVSAHIAASSCDLRRLVPFRRKNDPQFFGRDPSGMIIGDMFDPQRADSMTAQFALHAGNTRAYETLRWVIPLSFGPEIALEAVSDHRLAPSVHDLFVNDLHRRFFQRLHRHSMLDEPGQQRNCDNMEIYCGSPSYLISAGGRPAVWSIPGRRVAGHDFHFDPDDLGVAVPISFMPTGQSAGMSSIIAEALIQITMSPYNVAAPENGITDGTNHHGTMENYGVAPDFACGFGIHLPNWIRDDGKNPLFVDKSSAGVGPAGFYLAIHRSNTFVVLEAFDTWRHPKVSFDDFKGAVLFNNPSGVAPQNGLAAVYTTYFGNQIHYMIWQKQDFELANHPEWDNHLIGSKILKIEYGAGDPADTLVNAGGDIDSFLSGTIMKSRNDAVVEIHNSSLGTTLTLDWSDPHHLIRTSETGEVQQAGDGYEVWVDFDWQGPMEGDFYRPFNTLEGALNVVADGGVVRMMTGARQERLTIHKRVRLEAAGGPVSLLAR